MVPGEANGRSQGGADRSVSRDVAMDSLTGGEARGSSFQGGAGDRKIRGTSMQPIGVNNG